MVFGVPGSIGAVADPLGGPRTPFLATLGALSRPRGVREGRGRLPGGPRSAPHARGPFGAVADPRGPPRTPWEPVKRPFLGLGGSARDGAGFQGLLGVPLTPGDRLEPSRTPADPRGPPGNQLNGRFSAWGGPRGTGPASRGFSECPSRPGTVWSRRGPPRTPTDPPGTG